MNDRTARSPGRYDVSPVIASPGRTAAGATGHTELGSQRDRAPVRARGQGSGRGGSGFAAGGSWSPPGTQAVPFAIRSFQDSNGEPPVTSFIVMQPGTGQTAAHRLQPMHSVSSTHTM